VGYNRLCEKNDRIPFGVLTPAVSQFFFKRFLKLDGKMYRMVQDFVSAL